MLRASGLHTFQNFLSFIPEGSLLDATNVVIDRDGIIEPRRGIMQYGSFGSISSIAQQLLTYKGQVLVNYGDTIAYDNGYGDFTNFLGNYPEVEPGIRLKYIEMNGNLYIATGDGVQKIAANTTDLSIALETAAGGIPALDVEGTVNYGTAGFFTGLSQVAYRIVWGTTDINDNLILGDPSSRLVVINPNTTSATVNLTFDIPAGVTTNYFYQIYRTQVSTSLSLALLNEIDPGDEEQLIIENPVTAADLAAGVIMINDNIPQSFQQQGAYLYTNPVTGDGILQSNDPPPICQDIAIFQQSAFYANTRSKQSLELSLLGVENMEYGKILSFVPGSLSSIVNTTSNSLVTGDLVVIVGSGNPAVDTTQVVTVLSPTSFSIPVDATGANATDAWWFGSYITVTTGSVSNNYFFVGVPTITDATFDTVENTTNGSWFNIWNANNTIEYAIWFDTQSLPQITDIGIDNTGSTSIIASNGSWFTIWSANDATEYSIWFDATGVTVPPPAPGTLIRVDTSGFTSGVQVASAIASAVSAVSTDFIMSSSGATAVFTNSAIGPATAAAAGGIPPAGAFTATVVQTGVQTPTPSFTGEVAIPVLLSSVNSTSNVSSFVLDAVEAATNDFLVSQYSMSDLYFQTADNGPSSLATVGGVPPGGAFSISLVQQGFGEDAALNYILLSGYTSVGQAIAETAQSFINVINENEAESIYGFYLSGPTTVPGLINFELRTVADTSFSIVANDATTGGEFNPNLTTPSTSSATTNPNRLYFSKYQQPEAVPAVNYLDIGPKDKAILRIVPLRDSLFVFKQDGIYRVTGSVSPNFSVILFDNSVRLIATDSAGVLNNQVYALTDGGVATVSETGVGIISRPIENSFKSLYSPNYPFFSTATFGVGYESERSYYVWTVTNTEDTYATQCFRYNTFTQSWTRWERSQTCTVLDTTDNMMYWGNATTNIIDVERKNFTRTDYADEYILLDIPDNAVTSSTSVILSNTGLSTIGDALVQTQYLTINTFNMLLLKLDLDPRIGVYPGPFNNNYAALTMVSGDNLTDSVQDLVAALNADPGTSGGYSFNGSSDFATIQEQYNLIINQLNSDPLLKFKNYQLSVGTEELEFPILGINNNINTITTNAVPLLIVGPITDLKGIQTNIIWAPNIGTDPSLLKHYREATMLFETSNFIGGTVAYSSDLSPNFEAINFSMDGSGVWGGFIWGATTWGGGGTGVPFRTYVPLNKQRCRWIMSQLSHSYANYSYAVLGISYAYDISSDRAYRGKS